MMRIRLDRSLNNEDQTLNNTSITENGSDEVKMENILLNAVANGDHEKLDKLLCSGLSVEAENLRQSIHCPIENSGIPLHTAVALGHEECLKILIKHGVNLEAKDKFSCTALHLAAENGNYRCLKLLLKAGADCCAPIDVPYSDIVSPYIKGTTPLHLAAYYNHKKCVKKLIQYGANCDAIDRKGYTSLCLAAKAGYEGCVLTHLKYGHGSSFLSYPSFRCYNNTPLHFAVKHGMVKCVQHLIQLGANVNRINRHRFSPLNLACLSHLRLREDIRMQLVKTIVLEGHNTDMSHAFHQDLFNNCHPEVEAFLLAYGANINVKNHFSGLTFLESKLIRPGNFDSIKSIVDCMLQPPHIRSLNLSFNSDSLRLSEINVTSDCFEIPNGAAIWLKRVERDVYIVIADYHSMVIQTLSDETVSFCPKKKFVPLRQPFLNLVYEHINNELENESPISFMPDRTVRFCKNQCLVAKQQLWFEKMASNPRSLKHCCRFSIRKCMGSSNLKHIKKLPLPRKLLSYLMFEYGAFDA